jgi:hypothetical protein
MSRRLYALYQSIAKTCLCPARHPCGSAPVSRVHDLPEPQILSLNAAALDCCACQSVSALSTSSSAHGGDAGQHAASPRGMRSLPHSSHGHGRSDAIVQSVRAREAPTLRGVPVKQCVNRFKAGQMRMPSPATLHRWRSCMVADIPVNHTFSDIGGSSCSNSALQAAEDHGDAERMRSLMALMAESGTPPQV